jgi:hypothetical protein
MPRIPTGEVLLLFAKGLRQPRPFWGGARLQDPPSGGQCRA